jgi:hypothetical protein
MRLNYANSRPSFKKRHVTPTTINLKKRNAEPSKIRPLPSLHWRRETANTSRRERRKNV